MRIRCGDSLLLVVDVHERLAPAVKNREATIANIRVLMQAAARLGVPILISEHYPQGLGPTVAEVAELAPPQAVMEKIHFSCTDEPACARRIAAAARPQIVVAGMEAHVCVTQTMLGLSESGYRPFVVHDATASRTLENHALAMQRLRDAGVPVVSTEMVVFEWLHRGDTTEFRDLLPLIK